MKLLCLCPTYGRRRSLLENCLALFHAQDYPVVDRHLVLFDDLGTLGPIEPKMTDSVSILSVTERQPSYMGKYKTICDLFPDYDGYVQWDDDDIYLPWHLSAHAAVLANHGWSKPSIIWSTYAMPRGKVRMEDGRGRFPGSAAIRRDLLERIGGWETSRRADADQMMIGKLTAIEPPGDPCEMAEPSYVYRWQDSGGGHCSGLMKSPDNEDWYERYQPDSREPITDLTPRFDQVTEQILATLAGSGSKAA